MSVGLGNVCKDLWLDLMGVGLSSVTGDRVCVATEDCASD